MRRFRLFAGPNGSGKSTLYEYLRKNKEIHTELYISADRIEADIRRTGKFFFNAYRIRVSETEFFSRIKASMLLSEKMKRDYLRSVEVRSGQLRIVKAKSNSYLASVIADYLVHKLLLSGQSFCFETVMSHKSKIDILNEARIQGYRTYLYFVFTNDPKLNQLRVAHRTQMGGHSVPSEKIFERYYRSMNLLGAALRVADRAFVIDNSREFDTVAVKDRGKIRWLVSPKPVALANYVRS